MKLERVHQRHILFQRLHELAIRLSRLKALKEHLLEARLDYTFAKFQRHEDIPNKKEYIKKQWSLRFNSWIDYCKRAEKYGYPGSAKAFLNSKKRS